MKFLRRAPVLVLAGLSLSAACSAPLAAQDAAPLRVATTLADFVARDAPVVLNFNRAPVPPNERIAVFIDRTDVSGLFRRSADARALSYERGVVLLPSGEHELIVYAINGLTGDWTELSRQSFQTLGRFGFQPGKTDPSLTASWTGRVADDYDPESAAPPDADENVDLQFRLSTEHIRDNLNISSEIALVGANRRERALRYADKGDAAPKLDLASYRLDAANGPVSLSVGHVSGGGQRHLINNFAARGASLSVRPSDRIDLTLGAQGGSSEVGWSNLLGLNDGDHRVVSGSVGVEALPTPGALRVELTGMQGSILPRTGFNQGGIADAEQSHGLGLRLTAKAIDRRLSLDAGWASSTFDNPTDPSLDQGQTVVKVREESSAARYLDASFDAIRNLRLGASRSVRLTLGMRHERVDPLYRSLGAYARPDQSANSYDARADIAGLSVQGSWAEGRNNLDGIRSILTTRTERSTVNVGVPVARILATRSAWLPSLQLRRDRTHQFGETLPENGGFSDSHVPDQVSLNRTAKLEWRFSKVAFGLDWNRSEQDNRQVGRENADLNVTRRGVSVRVSPLRTLSMTVDLKHEAAENVQRDETNETLRWGGQLQWQPFDRSSLSARLSDTETEDLLMTRRRASRQLNLQWSSVLPRLDRFQGQYFLRFSRNVNAASDFAFGRDDHSEVWWLDLGLNFTFFQ